MRLFSFEFTVQMRQTNGISSFQGRSPSDVEKMDFRNIILKIVLI